MSWSEGGATPSRTGFVFLLGALRKIRPHVRGGGAAAMSAFCVHPPARIEKCAARAFFDKNMILLKIIILREIIKITKILKFMQIMVFDKNHLKYN